MINRIRNILRKKFGIKQNGIFKYPDKMEYNGKIYLYGENHGSESIINAEFEIWKDYYKSGLRHLFIEFPFFTSELLNLWLKEDNDGILNEIQNDLIGTAMSSNNFMNFYKKIKVYCPETILHGTDVGHQYKKTGKKYIEYLQSKKMEKTIKYALTIEAIEQGKEFYSHPKNYAFREKKMVGNFIRELATVNHSDIMGIYGAAHTGLNDLNESGNIPNMGSQLNKLLPNSVTSVDLTMMEIPLRSDPIIIKNKSYNALYFGKQELNGFMDCEYREYWKIENAFEDFKDNKKNRDILPYNNYPMIIKLNNLYKIRYKKLNGEFISMYYISNGKKWKGMLVTRNIEIL